PAKPNLRRPHARRRELPSATSRGSAHAPGRSCRAVSHRPSRQLAGDKFGKAPAADGPHTASRWDGWLAAFSADLEAGHRADSRTGSQLKPASDAGSRTRGALGAATSTPSL